MKSYYSTYNQTRKQRCFSQPRKYIPLTLIIDCVNMAYHNYRQKSMIMMKYVWRYDDFSSGKISG